jgi:hypothetical protein
VVVANSNSIERLKELVANLIEQVDDAMSKDRDLVSEAL